MRHPRGFYPQPSVGLPRAVALPLCNVGHVLIAARGARGICQSTLATRRHSDMDPAKARIRLHDTNIGLSCCLTFLVTTAIASPV